MLGPRPPPRHEDEAKWLLLPSCVPLALLLLLVL